MKFYTFTPRLVKLIERFVYVTLKELKQPKFDFELYDGCDIIFGFVNIEVGLNYQFDDEDDEEDDLLNELETIYIKFMIGNEVVLYKDLYNYQTNTWQEEEFYTAFEILKKKKFRKCKLPFCEQFTFNENEEYCKTDYIFDFTRKDNCCICLEDGGSWTKLSCNHFLHTCCYLHLRDSSLYEVCPLCKQSIQSIDVTHSFLEE